MRETNTKAKEDTLEKADDPEFYQLSKQGETKKIIPTLTMEENTYAGNSRIAECIVQHHQAGDAVPETTSRSKIPMITPGEVKAALAKAPDQSMNGEDDWNKTIILALH